MPTFSQSLEQSLHRALAIANERHHQYATLEHLLLSLIDDSDDGDLQGSRSMPSTLSGS
jgi:ATP-dependent Clp protease ATP-binding subunit ClpA